MEQRFVKSVSPRGADCQLPPGEPKTGWPWDPQSSKIGSLTDSATTMTAALLGVDLSEING
jgi:hypothetical protein